MTRWLHTSGFFEWQASGAVFEIASLDVTAGVT
jgi:hypothetical protein